MLPIWVPEITFGNALCITLIISLYMDTRMRIGRNEGLLKRNNDIATLAATHAKLTFDNSAAAATNLKLAVADTAAEIKNAVVSITAAAEATAAIYTPVATKLPAELRVTIAKEIDAPDDAAK